MGPEKWSFHQDSVQPHKIRSSQEWCKSHLPNFLIELCFCILFGYCECSYNRKEFVCYRCFSRMKKFLKRNWRKYWRRSFTEAFFQKISLLCKIKRRWLHKFVILMSLSYDSALLFYYRWRYVLQLELLRSKYYLRVSRLVCTLYINICRCPVNSW